MHALIFGQPPPKKKIKVSHEDHGEITAVSPHLPFEIREQIWKELALAIHRPLADRQRDEPAVWT